MYFFHLSRYKKVLTDDRHMLKTENISKILVTKCFYSRLDETEFAERKVLELVRKEVRDYKKAKWMDYIM